MNGFLVIRCWLAPTRGALDTKLKSAIIKSWSTEKTKFFFPLISMLVGTDHRCISVGALLGPEPWTAPGFYGPLKHQHAFHYFVAARCGNPFALIKSVPRDRPFANLRIDRKKRQTSSHELRLKVCSRLQPALLGRSPTATRHFEPLAFWQALSPSWKDRFLSSLHYGTSQNFEPLKCFLLKLLLLRLWYYYYLFHL